MGKSTFKEKRPFTHDCVMDRDLVIQMLKFEEEYNNSDEGQLIHKTLLNNARTSLFTIYTIHRVVLDHFDFDTSDESVETYRTIFKTYFRSPKDYDKDVINSAFYMRNNRCVFYERPELDIGDKMVNCDILTLDGKPTTLFEIIPKDFNYCFVGGFSLS